MYNLLKRPSLLSTIVVAALLFGCKKEDEAAPSPTTSTISSMCIGGWSVDSTYLPSSGQYYPVIPKTYTFSTNGQLTISSLGGVQSTPTFQVVEELSSSGPNEVGRTLIWATDTASAPDVHSVMLLIHQSASEGFLLISTSLVHESPWNTLASVNEDLVVSGNPIFPAWAKCYRQ
ncbi:MAG: hypothetical protein WAT74_09530 [Flavobacteriales bacterium]